MEAKPAIGAWPDVEAALMQGHPHRRRKVNDRQSGWRDWASQSRRRDGVRPGQRLIVRTTTVGAAGFEPATSRV
jgi:hypothetical protein